MIPREFWIVEMPDNMRVSPDIRTPHIAYEEDPRKKIPLFTGDDIVTKVREVLPDDGYLEAALRLDNANLEAQLEVAMESLEKLKNGPGNNMANWQFTWASEFSTKAIAKIEEIKQGKM